MFAEVERIIKIVDTIPPVLTIPENVVLTISEVESYDLMEGVSEEDNSEEEIEVTIEGSIAKIAGSYEITYKAKDSSGNEAIATRVIDVIDNEAPVITINGYNPTSINVGEEYNDQGATAIDDADGDISDAIIPSGSVNTNIPGTYYVTYYVMDSSENEAIATRTVKVIDNIAPTVTFGTNGNSTYGKNYSTTVTVNDQHGTVTNRYYQWTTSTTAPTSGTFSQIFTNGASITSPGGVTGDYYLWIKGIDNANNEIITRSNVFKLDNTVPIVTSVVSGASSITTTSFTITRSGNASDAHSGLSTNPYIYQTSPNGSTWTTRCTNNTTSCAVSGLTENTTYYYRICVNDILGNQSCVASKTTKTIREEYNTSKGVNKPLLATGMTPIKWNGSSWIDTTVTDPEWYDYTSYKIYGINSSKWANARTNDGSMWVWIPRYAYQIATCYRTSCNGNTGDINIKFLQGKTNTAADGTTVATIPTYSGNSQTNYVKHPAFTFGNKEITGFWVAKFEANDSKTALSFIPNQTSNVHSNIGEIFSIARNMETDSRYGWTTASGLKSDGTFTNDSNNLDTHMMKNTEWGAVAYLSIYSRYGKIAENHSSTYSTGCSGGDYEASNGYYYCLYQYNTTIGQQASTTGNIYGVYDMNGGGLEYVAAYGSADDSNLNLLRSYGASIINANLKYKNVYREYSANNFGDALYEITSEATCNNCSWYNGYSRINFTSYSWVTRGSRGNSMIFLGVANGHYLTGFSAAIYSFRVVIMVGDGL